MHAKAREMGNVILGQLIAEYTTWDPAKSLHRSSVVLLL
jgi:hypothetical protein